MFTPCDQPMELSKKENSLCTRIEGQCTFDTTSAGRTNYMIVVL